MISTHTHTTLQEKQCPSHSWTPLCSGSSFTSTCGEKHVPARHNRATSARWPRWPYGKNRWKFTNGPWWTSQGTQRRYWTSPSKICSTVVPMTTRLEALRSLRSAMKEIQYRRGFPGGHTSPWAESTNGWKFFEVPMSLEADWFTGDIFSDPIVKSDSHLQTQLLIVPYWITGRIMPMYYIPYDLTVAQQLWFTRSPVTMNGAPFGWENVWSQVRPALLSSFHRWQHSATRRITGGIWRFPHETADIQWDKSSAKANFHKPSTKKSHTSSNSKSWNKH